ncbi:MAG: GNAT family N-acetyltransferase [Actinobacteria bacterium]|nr:GNAT family N-acetyltransferase [Actinomycetota bacterium]
MSVLSITYTDKPDEDANRRLAIGHEEYEHEHGVEIDYRRFGFILADEDGNVFGALNAYTAYSEVCIEDLWVEGSVRRMGYGTQLLHALEGRFAGSQYDNINLVTNEFQAPEFYRRCGYEVEFIRVNEANRKLTKYFFIKHLR